MNFSNFTTNNFTGVQAVSAGVFAVVVRNVVRWEGPATQAEAEARLADYVN